MRDHDPKPPDPAAVAAFTERVQELAFWERMAEAYVRSRTDVPRTLDLAHSAAAFATLMVSKRGDFKSEQR